MFARGVLDRRVLGFTIGEWTMLLGCCAAIGLFIVIAG